MRLSPNPDTSEEGLERLKVAVKANPRSTAFVALAHGLCDAGRLVEAEEVCREGLVQHPDLVTARVALGRALAERGRLRAAQELLIEAAKDNPEHADAFRWLGDVTIRRGDRARARTILEYAEELAPQDGRIADLLREAGGQPTHRPPRPQTDFEHTKVGDARRLAQRMNEDIPEPDPLPVVRGWIVPARRSRPNNTASAPINQQPFPMEIGADEPTRVDAGPAADEPFPGGSPALASASARPRMEPSAIIGAVPRPSSSAALYARARQWARADDVPWWRRPKLLMGLAGAALVTVVLLAALAPRRQRTETADVGRQLGDAIARGSLDVLLEAREIGQRTLTRFPGDHDVAVALALVHGLLATDYGVVAPPESEALLADAAVAKLHSTPDRRATLEAARTLFALRAGDLSRAKSRADAALAAAPQSAFALLAAARVKSLSGDLDAARQDLTRIVASVPRFAPAALELATIQIDSGEPALAANTLNAAFGETGRHTRARLLLVEAERALGERHPLKPLERACQDDGKLSPSVRGLCALTWAADARLSGDRASAVKAIKSAAATITGAANATDARALAHAALLLAALGEIDAGAEIADEARRSAPQIASLRWAEMATTLGRWQPIEPSSLRQKPAGPDRYLVAARVAYATGGAAGLAETLKTIPTSAVAMDNDLKALGSLAKENGLTRVERADLDRRADRGNPVAAYALGRAAHLSGDMKTAARRLEKALSGHGDACAAAVLYVETLSRLGRPASPSHPALRSLRAKNRACPALTR